MKKYKNFNLNEPLIFVLGKGGVGRTVMSASLASYFSSRGEKTLVIQWSLEDSVSSLFDKPLCSHKEITLFPNFFVMNFDLDSTIREYVEDHLKLKWLHSLIIKNASVQKMIHASPGVSELFFLGRIFWLLELAKKERGVSYDRIIVDCPAMGHGVSLFTVTQSLSKLGLTGPLAYECERVSRMLLDKEKTATVVVTLLEELPIEETIDFLPKIVSALKKDPSYIFLNRSIENVLFESENQPIDLSVQKIIRDLQGKIGNAEVTKNIEFMLTSLVKRNSFKPKIENWLKQFNYSSILLDVPDLDFEEGLDTQKQKIEHLKNFF